MKTKISRLLFVISISISVLFFQNCKTSLVSNDSSPDLEKLSLGNSGGGNGDPYGGKLTYYAFAEGHVCLDSSGVERAAELARITEKAGKFTLEFDECQEKSIAVKNSEILKPTDANGVILYQGKGFVKQELPTQLSNHDFVFPIATCRETVWGNHQRTGGAFAPLKENESRVENHIEVDLVSNWYGERKAKVVSIDETKTYTPPNSVPMMIPPNLLWEKEYMPLSFERIGSAFHWWNQEFDYNASPNPMSTNDRYIIGTVSIQDSLVGSLESELSCVRLSNQ